MRGGVRPLGWAVVDYAAALVDQNPPCSGSSPATPTLDADAHLPRVVAQQLLRHVGRGHRWAATMRARRATSAADPRTSRVAPEGDVEWLHGCAADVLEAVAASGADTPMWTFTGPKPAAWWIRRRLHEATVHRADAALATGRDGGPVDPSWRPTGSRSGWTCSPPAEAEAAAASLADGATLHLHATDDGLGAAGEWMIRGDATASRGNTITARATSPSAARAVDLLLAPRSPPSDTSR